MKTALITGASRGIGKAIALKLAGLGYHVVITGRNRSLLEKVKSGIGEAGRECLVLEADLRHEDAPEKIVRGALEHFGRIDVLVNNAGMAHSAGILETSPEMWEELFAINARVPFFLCRAAIPALRKSDHPVIVNIGSVVGFKGYYHQSAYSASKHALAGFTKVLAKEVQEDGIRVHLISPGGVNTDMVRKMRPDIDTEKLIQPEEVAELVAFIVTRKGKGTIDHFYLRRQSGLAFD